MVIDDFIKHFGFRFFIGFPRVVYFIFVILIIKAFPEYNLNLFFEKNRDFQKNEINLRKKVAFDIFLWRAREKVTLQCHVGRKNTAGDLPNRADRRDQGN